MLTVISIFGAAFSLLAALYFAAKEKGFKPIDEAYESFRALNVTRRIVVALILVGFTYIGSTKSVPNPPPAELAVSYGPYVAGDKIEEIDFSFAEGYKIAGLPAGLKYDAKTKKVVGLPTKPGAYAVTLTKKGVDSQSTTFYVANYKAANEYIEDFPDNGFDNEAMANKEVVLFQGASDVSVMPSLTLKAGMLSDKAKIAVSGLPTGIKYDAKKGMYTGVPTKAGTFTMMITVSDAATKLKAISSVTIKVEALPEWAIGTFNGGFFDGDDLEGLVTLKVTAAGKISGKIQKNGLKNGVNSALTWTVTAASFDSYDEELGYHAILTAKCGKEEPETLEITLDKGKIKGDGIVAHWNAWKTVEGKKRGKEYAATYKKTGLPSDVNNLTLKFAASGAVTATSMFDVGIFDKKGNPVYYKATCSTVLIRDDDVGNFVYLYFAPNAKKGFGDGAAFIATINVTNED